MFTCYSQARLESRSHHWVCNALQRSSDIFLLTGFLSQFRFLSGVCNAVFDSVLFDLFRPA